MKRILIGLTLATAGAVVLVIAAYLSTVAVALIRANYNLKALVPRLEAIRDNAAPLDEDLAAINAALISLRDRLSSTDGGLHTIARLARGQ